MTYKAGIIGAGGIAGLGILGLHDQEDIGRKKFTASHAGGYHSTNKIELVAVADVDNEKLNTFGDAWDIDPTRRYLGHQSMLGTEDLDIISVCSPSYLHHDHVVDAARSAAAPDVIWCEKPIASNVSDAERMSEVCNETNTELVVNHSFRFTDKLQQLRALFKENHFGEIKSISGVFRRELLRNSTHLLDTIIFLMDDQASEVSGYINSENDAVDALGGDQRVDDAGGGGTVVMEDGTFITVDCTVARDISSMCLHFIGTEGKLYLNNDDGEWRYWELRDGEHVETSLPGIDRAWSWEVDYEQAFPNAARHLVNLLEGQTENRSTGSEATRSLEIIIGFYLSHYTGSRISMPLEAPLRDVTIISW